MRSMCYMVAHDLIGHTPDAAPLPVVVDLTESSRWSHMCNARVVDSTNGHAFDPAVSTGAVQIAIWFRASRSAC
jgi:hypothetical protein